MKASNEQISLAITLLKMGAKLDEIKKQTGLNPNQINQIEYKYELEKPWVIRKRLREEAALKEKPSKIPKYADRDKEICELALSGKTLQEIATQFDVTRERVRVILLKNNSLTPKDVRKNLKVEKLELDNQISQTLSSWIRSHMGCTMVELALGSGIKQADCVSHLPTEIDHLILNPGESANSNTWVTKKWTDNQILDGIRAAGGIKSPLSYVSFDRLRKEQNIDAPSAVRILQRFGTWKKACEQAGVKSGHTVRSNYHRNWTEEEMINWLATFMRQSSTSSHDAYNQWSKNQVGAPGGQTIRNTIGSWAECCELALLTLRKEWTEN